MNEEETGLSSPCIFCLFYKRTTGNGPYPNQECYNPDISTVSYDFVHGTKAVSYSPCKYQRAHDGRCGIEGKYFVQKVLDTA